MVRRRNDRLASFGLSQSAVRPDVQRPATLSGTAMDRHRGQLRRTSISGELARVHGEQKAANNGCADRGNREPTDNREYNRHGSYPNIRRVSPAMSFHKPSRFIFG